MYFPNQTPYSIPAYHRFQTLTFIAATGEPEAINMTRHLPNYAPRRRHLELMKLAPQMFIRCTRSEIHSKWHCSGDEKRINNDGRNVKLNINNIIKVGATANAINNNKWMVRLRSFRRVTGLPQCMHRLSDGYLECTSESPYSVQNMANIRIRLIFDSSNTLVNRLGPNLQ